MKEKLIFTDYTIEYEVKHSDRKTIGIQMDRDLNLYVRVPQGMPNKEVIRVVEQHRKWIYQKYCKLKNVTQLHKFTLENGQAIPFMGKNLIIEQVEADSLWIAMEYNKLRVGMVSGSENLRKELILDWYRKTAHLHLETRVFYWAEKMSLCYGRIHVKNQKTLWGSCSSKRNLNFNWKLIMMPEEIIDYVVVHELAHLKVMNHSPQFWAVVERQLPNYKENSAWLKEHGKDYEFET